MGRTNKACGKERPKEEKPREAPENRRKVGGDPVKTRVKNGQAVNKTRENQPEIHKSIETSE